LLACKTHSIHCSLDDIGTPPPLKKNSTDLDDLCGSQIFKVGLFKQPQTTPWFRPCSEPSRGNVGKFIFFALRMVLASLSSPEMTKDENVGDAYFDQAGGLRRSITCDTGHLVVCLGINSSLSWRSGVYRIIMALRFSFAIRPNANWG